MATEEPQVLRQEGGALLSPAHGPVTSTLEENLLFLMLQCLDWALRSESPSLVYFTGGKLGTGTHITANSRGVA